MQRKSRLKTIFEPARIADRRRTLASDCSVRSWSPGFSPRGARVRELWPTLCRALPASTPTSTLSNSFWRRESESDTVCAAHRDVWSGFTPVGDDMRRGGPGRVGWLRARKQRKLRFGAISERAPTAVRLGTLVRNVPGVLCALVAAPQRSGSSSYVESCVAPRRREAS